jgi:DNA-binding MarR family transcriptional regulator
MLSTNVDNLAFGCDHSRMPLAFPATDNLKQLLLARNEWFARALEREIARSPYAYLTPAEGRLLAHMAGKPSHMAELARRLGVSRQAVHKTVTALAHRGILELAHDPARGNTKLVLYTEKGREVNREGAGLIAGIEARLEARIGAMALEELKAILGADWGES